MFIKKKTQATVFQVGCFQANIFQANGGKPFQKKAQDTFH